MVALGFLLVGGIGIGVAGMSLGISSLGSWSPLTALASGRANAGALLFAAGWLWLAGLALSRWTRGRAAVSNGLVAIAGGIAPREPAESGVSRSR
jgi:hypothetical protein